MVAMLLANEKTDSVYPSFHCIATSTDTPSRSPVRVMTSGWIGVLARFKMIDEGDDAAFVEELVALLLAALVRDRDPETLVQEGELAETLRQDLEAEVGGLEDLRVRF